MENPVEIERKFLLDSLPFDLSVYKKQEITQTYISIDPVIRLRQKNDKHYLTVKGAGTLSRKEMELEITSEQFHSLSEKRETSIISKSRFIIPLEGGLNAELDIYKSELFGLLTVEVEFSSIETAENFSPPNWFGTEVTGNPAYTNSNLAKRT